MSQPTQSIVGFRDGSQLLAASVHREGSTIATAEFWWAPSVRSEEASFQVRLFPTDGGKAIDLPPALVGAPQGAVAQISIDIENDALSEPHAHWVSIRLLNRKGDAILAPPFPGNWVSVGVISGVDKAVVGYSVDPSTRLSLVFGGDTNLGRRQNGITGSSGPKEALGQLSQMFEADLSVLNLECVLAEVGEYGVPKGEPVPFYFRGRQEQVNVLTAAGIDVVATANNHAGDYGTAALLDQARILREAGILSAGSGATLKDACSPVYIERDGVRIGFVSADATLSDFQASESGAGTCHVSRKDVDAAMAVLAPPIEQARAQADIVFVAMHWGRNKKSRPSQATRRLGAAIIEAGADAILGSSAHQLQGVEVVDGRPILYDAGNLLFDSHADGEMTRSGVFRLDFDQSGVYRVELRPIDLDYGYSLPAQGNSGARSLIRFRDLSAELGTLVELRDGVARIGLPVPASRPKVQRDEESGSSRITASEIIRPAAQPPPGCVVDEVPEEAKIEPVSWGPIRLLGIRMRPAEPTERRTVWLESWWSTERQIVDDLWIYQRVKSDPFRLESMWWADHEHCDWAWPTSRWRPGEIIKDVYGLRPPKSAQPGRYELVMGLIRHEERLGDGVRMFQFQYQ